MCINNSKNNRNLKAQQERLLAIDSRQISNVDRLLHRSSIKILDNKTDYIANEQKNSKQEPKNKSNKKNFTIYKYTWARPFNVT